MTTDEARTKSFSVEYFHVGLHEWLLSGKKFTTLKMAERHKNSLIRHGYSPCFVRIKKLELAS